MKKSVQNIGEELVTQAEAVAPAERRCDSRADHDFAMGKCQDIGRGRVAQVKLVKAAAFLGRNKNDTELRGKFLATIFRKALECAIELTTEKREADSVAALAIAPVDGDGFYGHGDL